MMGSPDRLKPKGSTFDGPSLKDFNKHGNMVVIVVIFTSCRTSSLATDAMANSRNVTELSNHSYGILCRHGLNRFAVVSDCKLLAGLPLDST